MSFYSVNSNHSLVYKAKLLYKPHPSFQTSNTFREKSTYGKLCSRFKAFVSNVSNFLANETIFFVQKCQERPSCSSFSNLHFKLSPNTVLADPFFIPLRHCRSHLLNWSALLCGPGQSFVTFDAPSSKSQHLFYQIRAFKTMQERKLGFTKSSGLMGRMKNLLGLRMADMTPNERMIQKGNLAGLAPGKNKKELLSFAEGYLAGKERLLHKPQSRYMFFFVYGIVAFTNLISAGFFILIGVYIFSIINTLNNDSDVAVKLTECETKFNDVKGADEAKEELKNVVEFLKNPEKFSSIGGKLPKGVLLVGPPGTGKTLLAKAVAGEAGVPFFSTAGPEFEEIYVGVGAKRVRDLFQLAKENIPCVIFIDEIDSIGKTRTSSTLVPYANDTVNQLLSEMDGFRNSSGIIVLGATNRKEDLDAALLRPGRFDVEITVSLPDYRGRKELIEFYLSRVKHQDVHVEKLARGSTNFTGADIENMVNQAALRAATIGAQYVTTELLEYARDKTLMGPESLSRIADEETNRITAYHEAGHTVVAYFTEHAQPLHKVTIVARGSALGHTAYIPDKDIYHVTKEQLLAMMDSMMGGRAAEELIFGLDKVTSGASSDLEKATELASKMVMKWGMSDEVGLTTYKNQSFISPQAANIIDKEVKKLLQDSYERAKDILIKHKEKHKELSEALLKYETLNADEIGKILKGKPRKEKFHWD